MTEEYNAEITAIEKINTSLWVFEIKTDQAIDQVLSGQFLSIGLVNDDQTKLIKRAYSISDNIFFKHKNLFELYIVLVDGGELTPKLFTLNIGDRLFVKDKALGHYLFPDITDKNNVIFASTGTGIAPHLTMLNQAITNSKHVHLFDCVRFKKDLAYYNYLTELSNQQSNFTYIPLATREDKTKTYIQDFFSNEDLRHQNKITITDDTHVFLCGNPKMIGIPKKDRDTDRYIFPEDLGLIQILMTNFNLSLSKGKVIGNIHFEKYW